MLKLYTSIYDQKKNFHGFYEEKNTISLFGGCTTGYNDFDVFSRKMEKASVEIGAKTDSKTHL